ncbi:histidine kinase [Epilithonimonas hispanica]|uniref:Histidine kinase n=1 Tax=Epilithonimonas hispanica TaxID=358687 RepID=A0A3D9D191_9FLAO|nr:histidine kinase [Epilithonimonas hispanica]REC71734.1 histidine kinase [Epilithonimonas hispanica]
MNRIIVLFAIIFSQIIFAQTAKEIIDRNIESSGGLTQWKLLNTVQIQGRVTLGVNDSYLMKIYQQRPNLTKTAILLAGKETPVEGFDGKNGYAMNYAQNKLTQYNDYVPENFDNDFIDYESKGFEAELLGKEKIGEQVYFKVELTKNVNKTIYYFDVKNYSLYREIKKDETLTYSDYRKVGNLLMPYRIESSSPKKDSDYVMMINKIEINKELPKNTFKF